MWWEHTNQLITWRNSEDEYQLRLSQWKYRRNENENKISEHNLGQNSENDYKFQEENEDKEIKQE